MRLCLVSKTCLGLNVSARVNFYHYTIFDAYVCDRGVKALCQKINVRVKCLRFIECDVRVCVFIKLMRELM